jgi:hypothetical protein
MFDSFQNSPLKIPGQRREICRETTYTDDQIAVTLWMHNRVFQDGPIHYGNLDLHPSETKVGFDQIAHPLTTGDRLEKRLLKRTFSTGVPIARSSGREATLLSIAVGPRRSRPAIGPIESAKGSPASLPSGVAPTLDPCSA